MSVVVWRSVKTKLLLFATGIVIGLAVVAASSLLWMQRAVDSTQRIRRDCLPTLQCVYRAGQALRQSSRIRDGALVGVTAPEAFDDVRQYEGRLQATLIQFDMYMKALIWGSESETFQNSAGGLTDAEWRRI